MRRVLLLVCLIVSLVQLGRAMLNVTKQGFPKPVLENRGINRVCAKDA